MGDELDMEDMWDEDDEDQIEVEEDDLELEEDRMIMERPARHTRERF